MDVWNDEAERRATDEAVNDPRPGDRYHEMFSFWLYVVAVDGDSVVTMEAWPPCEFPKDGKLRIQTRAEFKQRLSYRTIPGYWVMLADRGNDVRGWSQTATNASEDTK